MDRLVRDGAIFDQDPELEQLVFYLDFGDLYQLINQRRSAIPAAVGDHIREFTDDFERLIPIRNRVAHVRPLHFEDFPTVLDIAAKLEQIESPRWSSLRDMLKQIRADPSFVLGLEIPAFDSDEPRLHNLRYQISMRPVS